MRRSAMRAIQFRSLVRHSLPWLAWLAMLLPVAQFAATWHGYSHVQGQASEREQDKQAPHAAHCDLCLTAAAVSGGALVGAAPKPPDPAARHALPQAAAGGVWPAFPTLAYLSRAPPHAPR